MPQPVTYANLGLIVIMLHHPAPEGTQFLDYLLVLFGVSIVVSTVSFVGASSVSQVHELIGIVMVIEAAWSLNASDGWKMFEVPFGGCENFHCFSEPRHSQRRSGRRFCGYVPMDSQENVTAGGLTRCYWDLVWQG